MSNLRDKHEGLKAVALVFGVMLVFTGLVLMFNG